MKDQETHDLEFVRDYNVALARLWFAVTDPGQVVQWMGPEGVRLVDCAMDLTRVGPWHCVMEGKESGDRWRVSGVVTSVRPPKDGRGSVAFTWAWDGDDDDDALRGESHVTFTVEETGDGARLTLTHRGHLTRDGAQAHTAGWLSTLRCLDVFLDN